MDNLTHSLTGLALARSGLNRFCPRATWLLLLSANIPDGDVITSVRGAFAYFVFHRGYSHSLICAPLFAALSVAIIATLFRQRLPWLRAWSLALLGIASHLLLDWTNSYGIRFFLPFSSSWSHLDLNNLYDGWIWAALLLGLTVPLLSLLVGREIGERKRATGRLAAILALLFFLAFDLSKIFFRSRVIAQFDSLLYESVPALATSALPDAFNPLRWRVIVETADSFRVFDASVRAQPDLQSADVFFKMPESPATHSLRVLDPFHFFLYFARFPVWSERKIGTPDHPNTIRVDLTDLRFGTPDAGSFHCVAQISGETTVLGKWFTFGSGAGMGEVP